MLFATKMEDTSEQSRPQRRTTTAPAAPLTPLVCVASVSAASRGKLAGGKLAGESAETEATQTSGAESGVSTEPSCRSGLAELAELPEQRQVYKLV